MVLKNRLERSLSFFQFVRHQRIQGYFIYYMCYKYTYQIRYNISKGVFYSNY